VLIAGDVDVQLP